MRCSPSCFAKPLPLLTSKCADGEEREEREQGVRKIVHELLGVRALHLLPAPCHQVPPGLFVEITLTWYFVQHAPISN